MIGSTGTTLSAVNAQTPQQQGNKWLRQAQVIVERLVVLKAY